MPKHPKSREARELEVAHLTSQLDSVGLPDEVTEPVRLALRDFASTGQGYTHTHKVEGTRIAMVCLFSAQAHITSHIRITPRR